jgi:hypothetical protein
MSSPVLSKIPLNPRCVFDFRVSCGGPQCGTGCLGPVRSLRPLGSLGGPGASLRPRLGSLAASCRSPSGALGGAAVGDLVRLDYVA